jgi:hypothetical protein
VLACGHRQLRVLRLGGGGPDFEGDAAGLWACGFLPDGRLLTLGVGGRVRLWPAELFRAG